MDDADKPRHVGAVEQLSTHPGVIFSNYVVSKTSGITRGYSDRDDANMLVSIAVNRQDMSIPHPWFQIPVQTSDLLNPVTL